MTAAAASALWTGGFTRLLTTRLVSQLGDGAFAAGVAFLVLLSPDAQRTPGAYAGALALLLLPFCLVGPFAASLLDRWRRRQVLVWGQALRAVIGLGVAALAAGGERGPSAYVAVLLALGVNRLLLAALSAAVPHVVDADRYVDANALGPTAGTVATGAGAGLGAALAAGVGSWAAVLLAVALCTAAAVAAHGFGRGALGPHTPGPGASPTLLETGHDLVAALAHLRHRHRAGLALLRFGAFRFVLGAWTLTALVAVGADGPGAVAVAAATAAGFGAGAVLTPVASRLVRIGSWVAVTAVVAGVLLLAGSLVAGPPGWAVAGAGFGLVGQSLKIWTDTLVQRHVDEVFLGRAFTLYDLVYNASFVLGALLALTWS